MTPQPGIPGDEPHGRWSVNGKVWHTCTPDGECFCMYDDPNAVALLRVDRLRERIRNLGCRLYTVRVGGEMYDVEWIKREDVLSILTEEEARDA